ncbi:MAG: hypothetical protein DRQ47_03720 [Gammaproteobacteria bacterium]|nr:MAG: hypothetical protein DRQ47_03720 [Gammaproteobacteria bacterium]
MMSTLMIGLIPGELAAHQKKEAITRIIFNQRTSNIEIIHRFAIHDAEHASKKLFGTSFDILGNTFSQKHFADYVAKNFSLKNLSGDPLTISEVGFEIAGQYLWIYQETPLQADIKGFIIKNNALRDIWSDQVNLVNIERNKTVRSLIFKSSLDEQQLTF